MAPDLDWNNSNNTKLTVLLWRSGGASIHATEDKPEAKKQMRGLSRLKSLVPLPSHSHSEAPTETKAHEPEAGDLT